ncbi:MAG: hypothetical protein RL189_2287 [Pseudomonadota bacterium]|jgi:hypothetical protein
MHKKDVFPTGIKIFLNLSSAFCFLWSSLPASASTQCGSDGFCTIISVQNEVEQKTPHSSGVVIGTITDDRFAPAPVAQTVAKKMCRKEVRVPREVHRAVTKMFEFIDSKGGAQGVPPSFTPAEQTILLYYNTIMQQTLNFQCN